MNHIASRDPVNGRGKSNGKAPRLAPAKIRADEVELHPLVEAFPELPRDELGRMAEILREAGASASFLICGDQLIDSRNRFAACRLAGVEIEFREWKDSGLSVAGSLAETVARLNLPPHLDDARRAALGVPVLIALQLENQARQRKGLRAGRNTQKTAVLAKSPVAANLQRRENPIEGTDGGEAKSLSPLEGEKGGGEDRDMRCAERLEPIFDISARSIFEAKKLYHEHRPLYDRLLLPRRHADKLNLNQARLAAVQKSRRAELFRLSPPPKRASGDSPLIIIGDCLKIMPTLKPGSVDLIFVDPEYNIRHKYDADPFGDRRPEPDYLDSIERRFRAAADLLTPAGSFFVLINGQYQSRFDGILRNLGLHWRNTIIWRDHFPNYNRENFSQSARFIHYFVKSAKKFTWNPDAILEKSARQLLGDQRRVNEGIVPFNVWAFPRVTGNSHDRVHFEDAPPQVPDKLLKRIILVASNPGDMVLDPQCGNGTTIKAALELGRRAQGIERSPLYASQALAWINGGGKKS